MQSAELSQIENLSDSSTELLSAVGVENLVSLAQSDEQGLCEELKQANGHLELEEVSPSEDEVVSWILKARKIMEEKASENVVRLAEVVEEVVSVPLAMLVEKDYILKHEISVSDVPVMEEFVEEEKRVSRLVVEKPKPRKEEPNIRQIKPRNVRQKSTSYENRKQPEEEKRERRVVEPLKKNTGFDLRKTARAASNKGKKMHSRGYVRGVLHPQLGKVRLAAFVTFMTLILFPASFVAGGLVIAKDLLPFEVSLWVLVTPLMFLIFSFLYLAIARSLKCRICGQPLFSPKACHRHVKAHRFPMLGNIFPTCLHMLFFHWFRCAYCGTSVRLKE
ncbi:MAG: hypothetical protein ACI9NQ_000265 [Paracoccaceae bacterium]|jgi:hypothetical protein